MTKRGKMTKRGSMKGKSMKRRSMKRRSMKGKSMKRKSMKRKSMKRKYTRRGNRKNRRLVGGSTLQVRDENGNYLGNCTVLDDMGTGSYSVVCPGGNAYTTYKRGNENIGVEAGPRAPRVDPRPFDLL